MELWGRISGAPHGLLALSLLLLLLLAIPNATAESDKVSALVDHGGEMLKGNLDLSIVFYGQFGRIQKNALRAFLKSLNQKAPGGGGPSVSSWWHMVSSYTHNDKDIDVRVVQQYVDPNYAHGKVMTRDFIKILVEKALVGFPHAVAVIVAARDVTVEGLCIGRCSEHGDIDGKPYVILGNPETECPGACAWPFHKSDYGPAGPVLKPPSGDVGADAMVISLASGLASVVSNPFRTGLYLLGHKGAVIEATTACPGMFGTGATPGYTGKVSVDIPTGGAYNAIGFKGKKFLLPALWNPNTHSCWTVM